MLPEKSAPPWTLQPGPKQETQETQETQEKKKSKEKVSFLVLGCPQSLLTAP
jgi:hypothetical protein